MGILDRCLPAAVLLKDDGSKLYSRAFLRIYDFSVLWLNNTFAWHCPTDKVLLPLYRSAMGPDHLEIGVGTGYYPAEALRLGQACRSITLVDLNAATLEAATHRISSACGSARPSSSSPEPSSSASSSPASPSASPSASSASSLPSTHQDLKTKPAHDSSETQTQTQTQTHPQRPPSLHTILANAMQPLPLPPSKKFDSISLFYLLHCIPLPPHQKANIFDLARSRLRPSGTLVGSTILGAEVPRNAFAEFNMRLYNKSGVFHNWDDTRGVFEDGLKRNFEDVEVHVVGNVMTWKATRPREV